MRLATVKLAGFKSFVDPTTLHLPTNMTAVVGPNGCGKSNIIDAVKWVLGESAASRLRGDSMTDVIFNGTTERKPVGQASVELIFDNSDASVLGEYAAYNEISVRRVVGRDGLSQYWLNGTKCRRRDVTDLFLGTGLGPRSYAIIEQGMISQIVEAAPDDLRVHLEEAAGISKYKERRRETESRMRATRENLERLKDVSDEVDKQLEHLRRQARQAERWSELRAEQRKVDAQAKALGWRALAEQLAAELGKLKQAELLVEQLAAEHARNEVEGEASRAQQQAAAETFRAVQAEHYQVGAEIARIEQQLAFRRDTIARLKRELLDAGTQRGHLDEQLRLDREQGVLLQQALQREEPRLEALVDAAAERADALAAAERALADWHARADTLTRAAADATRAAEVERTRIDYLDKQMHQALKRREILDSETAMLAARGSADELGALRETLAAEEETVSTLAAVLDARKAAVAAADQAQRAQQAELNQQRQQLSAARGRLASLEALQHAALGEDRHDLATWLARHGLQQAPRLGTLLQVEPGWEAAVETALGLALEAVVVAGASARELELAGLPKGVLTLVDADAPAASAAAGTLAARVHGPAALAAWLGSIRTAGDASQAAAMAARLAPHESAISADGHWYGPGWRRIDRGRQGHEGVLQRGREIEALKRVIDDAEARSAELEDALRASRAAHLEAEHARELAQTELYAAHRRLADCSGKVKSHEGKVEQERARREAIAREREQIGEQIAQSEQHTREARGKLHTEMARLETLAEDRERLEAERQRLGAAREAARNGAREAQEGERQLALSVESKRTAARSLAAAIARIEAQLAQLGQRREQLEAQLRESEDPLPKLEAELRLHLDQRVLVDQRLSAARQQLEQLDQRLRRHDHERQRIDHQLAAAREKKGQAQLAEQAIRIKAETLEQALAAEGFERDAVIAELDPEATLPAWEARLADLETRIKRLEPVNLAAIQELEEQTQRKTYLDAQHADLSEALETLDEAIRKIDRETRTRFKETFDRVNAGVQELFPRLFGGGHAYLELTGEDLLSTGVNIIARPPGKKPASIGLLSGGEKALTAVSLVFAIFRLNPAPFCLLDEVDAPLDEANVGRFSQMVVEMSKSVQFLIVTHNKVTMEASNQLAGVTMREPGVSRLVSVDLAEAARLVA
ncbi:MAG: chromosome segregation protein SMC [Xanthomonadales bacterium PRO6]|nr:chromosome segregation protein SMC [Xanthomonadales bacterium PRO6]